MTTVSQARADHAMRHRRYLDHLPVCRHGCKTGGLCSLGRTLLIDADAASWRLDSAVERERAGRAPVAAEEGRQEPAADRQANTVLGAAPRVHVRASAPLNPTDNSNAC
jgi:hypothetical protein